MAEYKTCKNCYVVRDLEDFGNLKWQGKPYKRGVCKPCHSEVQYQRYLSIKYENRVRSIYQCECSNFFSDVTHSFNQCKECRIYKNGTKNR